MTIACVLHSLIKGAVWSFCPPVVLWSYVLISRPESKHTYCIRQMSMEMVDLTFLPSVDSSNEHMQSMQAAQYK